MNGGLELSSQERGAFESAVCKSLNSDSGIHFKQPLDTDEDGKEKPKSTTEEPNCDGTLAFEDTGEPSQGSLPFYRLFSYADGVDYLLMLIGGLGAATHGAAVPVFFIFFGKLIDAMGNGFRNQAQVSHEVAKYSLDFVYLSIVVLVSGWLEVSCWMYTGERQSARIRLNYLKAMLGQDVGFFDTDTSTGEIVVGISSDTILVQEAIGEKTGNYIHYMARFFAGFAVGFSSVWQLSLVTLSVVPLIAMAGGSYAYIMIGLTNKSKHAYIKASEIAEQTMAQIRTVCAFGGETKAVAAYVSALDVTQKLGKKGGLAKGVGVGSMYGLLFCAWALLLWFSGKLVRSGVTNGGQAFTTILNVIISGLSLGQAAPDLTAFGKAKVAGYTIMEMIKKKPNIDHSDFSGKKFSTVAGHIELKNVSFSYPSRPGILVFQDFCIDVPAGKVVAIVGSSGSGKSTVISLIERFYDPNSGEVLLDGHNVKDLQLRWLREQIGLVNQEPALFATSIRENILYGKDDATMEEIVHAASISGAHVFIEMLPLKYETQVGERGVQMSGGQKQRIAIARAMVKNPSILLLDEATSALDAESEKSVQEALDCVMVGRTTVIVAHRLSTVRNADFIAVVQNGRVVEYGPHIELIKNEKGAYASLVKLQEASVQQPVDSASISHHKRLSRGSLSQRTFSFRSTVPSDSDAAAGFTKKLYGSEQNTALYSEGRSSMKRLLLLNLEEWPYGLVGAFGAIVAGAETPLFALAITQSLEAFYSPDKRYMKHEVNMIATIFCGAAIVTLLVYTLEHYFFGIVGERLTMRVRKMMFSAILRNEMGWFDKNSSSLLAARLSSDGTLVKAAVADRISTLLQNFALIVTAFIIAFLLEWRVALIIVGTYPALIASHTSENLFLKGYGGDRSKCYSRSNMVAGEAVSNIRTVAAFSAENKVLELFNKELEAPKKQAFLRGQIAGLGYGVAQFCMYSSYALALWYASTLIQKGEVNFGQVMKCFMVLILTAFGIAETLALAPDIVKGSQALSSVFEILDRKTEIDPDDPEAAEVTRLQGAIELKNIEFSYPSRPSLVIFKDFNLKVHPGRSLALVGASGSGKSSVIGLIARFYDPQAGQVLIDGKDIKKLKLTSLRQHMGLVQQEPALFSTSIYENIRYGRDNATETEIMEAAKTANAYDFICGLVSGYSTEVGERGVQLSGGQKQRIAIARAVLRNPAILLLDEATSALDTESEKIVQDALDKLMIHRTTIIIAHRLSTIRNADAIAVLQGGNIVEQGTHQELLVKAGAYCQLVKLQQNNV